MQEMGGGVARLHNSMALPCKESSVEGPLTAGFSPERRSERILRAIPLYRFFPRKQPFPSSVGSRSVSLSVQRCPLPQATLALLPAARPLGWGRPAEPRAVYAAAPRLCCTTWASLCSWARGEALINARRRAPTAASGFFLAAEVKSQVLWGSLPRVTPLPETSYVTHGPLDRGRKP